MAMSAIIEELNAAVLGEPNPGLPRSPRLRILEGSTPPGLPYVVEARRPLSCRIQHNRPGA